MIFQGAIDLDIENRNVQAIIDFDTGLIGFTEMVEDKTIEYFFGGSPKSFKVTSKRAVSWSHKPVQFHIYTVDRYKIRKIIFHD